MEGQVLMPIGLVKAKTKKNLDAENSFESSEDLSSSDDEKEDKKLIQIKVDLA